MSDYIPTIGLEVHAELKTQTKMFCDSLNDPNETRPNVNVCPVCMGHPGTLPVVNKEAVRQVLRMGVAMGGTLADYTEFDRKNYFYPDLPKGYQISQFEFPLVKGGELNGVQITRIHLEEDAARTQHPSTGSTSSPQAGAGGFSLVDFNRAGLPLMELVTEPCMHDAKTASAFAQELQRLIRALGAGDANMEKGQMRVEANISVAPPGKISSAYVEVKNINSFRSVERAIAFEIERQTALLNQGEVVVKETRGWDDVKNVTFSQRIKEDSQEYRYFPDPDIPKFYLSRVPEFALAELKKSLPELPWEKRARYISLGLKKDDAELLVTDEVYASFFDAEIVSKFTEVDTLQLGINYLLSDVRGKGITEEHLNNIRGGVFAALITLIQSGQVSSRAGKDLLVVLLEKGGDPILLASELGLGQMTDTNLIAEVADAVISENHQVVSDFKAGKLEAIKYLVGQGMRKSKGTANPEELEKILKNKLTVDRGNS